MITIELNTLFNGTAKLASLDHYIARALEIAGDICIYTNKNITLEKI